MNASKHASETGGFQTSTIVHTVESATELGSKRAKSRDASIEIQEQESNHYPASPQNENSQSNPADFSDDEEDPRIKELNK